MTWSSYMGFALIAGICIASAVAGAILKRAVDLSHVGLFGIAILIYSVSSVGLFYFYRLESEASFAFITFTCLLGGLLATQIISATVLHEPVNWRALTVLLIAICAFVWPTHAPTHSETSSRSNPHTHGDTP